MAKIYQSKIGSSTVYGVGAPSSGSTDHVLVGESRRGTLLTGSLYSSFQHGYWSFNGDITQNGVGTSNNSLTIGTTVGSTKPIFGPGPIPATYSLTLDGGTYYSDSDTSFQQTSHLIIEFLIYPTAPSNNVQTVISQKGSDSGGNSGNNEVYGIYIGASPTSDPGGENHYAMLYYNHQTSGRSNVGAELGIVYFNQWNHVFIKRSTGTNITSYINGFPMNAPTIGGAPDGGGSSILNIGANVSDQVRFANPMMLSNLIIAWTATQSEVDGITNQDVIRRASNFLPTNKLPQKPYDF